MHLNILTTADGDDFFFFDGDDDDGYICRKGLKTW